MPYFIQDQFGHTIGKVNGLPGEVKRAAKDVVDRRKAGEKLGGDTDRLIHDAGIGPSLDKLPRDY